MYAGRRVLAVIPARGGSKGIPLKNLQPVGGVPLVTRAAQVAGKVEEIDCTVVSTDNDEIAEAAITGGALALFRRPDNLSGDSVADHPVLLHALDETERALHSTFDIVLMLQPTSPFRTAEHLRSAIIMLVDRNLEAVWSLSETDSKAHPLKQFVVRDGQLDYYDPEGARIIARQQLSALFHRNGIVYAFTSAFLRGGAVIKAPLTGALLIKEFSVNIDTPLDLEIAEYVLNKYGSAL